jgi:hypothetical protein
MRQIVPQTNVVAVRKTEAQVIVLKKYHCTVNGLISDKNNSLLFTKSPTKGGGEEHGSPAK